jgi:hypothetical protein
MLLIIQVISILGIKNKLKGMPELYKLDYYLSHARMSMICNVHLLIFSEKYLSACLQHPTISAQHAKLVSESVELFLNMKKCKNIGHKPPYSLLKKFYDAHPSVFSKFSRFEDMAKCIESHIMKCSGKKQLMNRTLSDKSKMAAVDDRKWRKYLNYLEFGVSSFLVPQGAKRALLIFTEVRSHPCFAERHQLSQICSLQPKELLRQLLQNNSKNFICRLSLYDKNLNINAGSFRVIEMMDRKDHLMNTDNSGNSKLGYSPFDILNKDIVKIILSILGGFDVDHALFILPLVCKEWNLIVSTYKQEILSCALSNSTTAASKFISDVAFCSWKKLNSSYVYPWKVLTSAQLLDEVIRVFESSHKLLRRDIFANEFFSNEYLGDFTNIIRKGFQVIFETLIESHNFRSFEPFSNFISNCISAECVYVLPSAALHPTCYCYLFEYMIMCPTRINSFYANATNIIRLVNAAFSCGYSQDLIEPVFDALLNSSLESSESVAYLAVIGHIYSPGLYQSDTVQFCISQQTDYSLADLANPFFAVNHIDMFCCEEREEKSYGALRCIVDAVLDGRLDGSMIISKAVLKMIPIMIRHGFSQSEISLFIEHFPNISFESLCEGMIDVLLSQ